jgi:hypothetical protein
MWNRIGLHQFLITDIRIKIVQRFYETPEDLSSGSNKRKAKIPIPAAPKTGFPLRFNTLLGYFGIFTSAHRAVVPHFSFKKDLILYLNSSRAAPKVGISVSLQQAAGNSNLNIPLKEVILCLCRKIVSILK